VRWVGVGGLLACVLFLGVSVGLGTLCLTCLTTYVLTALYAVATFRLPSEAWLRLPGVRIPAATVAVVYLLLLYPGRATPTSSGDAVQQALQNSRKSAPAKQPTPSAPPPRNEPSRPASPLARFLRELPGPARRAVVDAVQAYRSSEPVVEDRYGTRPKVGPAGAPVRIVDFVDVGCSHCAHLMETLDQIRRELPGSPFTVETRYFPLDGACNAVIPGGSGDPLSTRCLGAKLLLCGQDNAGYDALKHRIFENHARLTPADLYRWSTELLGEERGALDACVNDSKTEKKLAADVDFAKNFNPRGTPIVVINGREAAPLPPFLYAIILAQGDPKASGFQELGL
jgi:protein-disulfide isomerase